MTHAERTQLLARDESAPYQLERAQGTSDFVFLCDHAGTQLPRALGDLGLPPQELQRHIGWDIGAAAVTQRLSAALDATAVLQPYSRLVIDCNRPLHSPSSIAGLSERTVIPGNHTVSAQDRERRQREIFEPYHACIRQLLDARAQQGRRTLLVAMHSFTPVYDGVARPWHAGVLYNRDPRMARLLSAGLREDPALCVGDNQPYDVSDESDYSIPEHGERRGLAHVELEIRQDLIDSESGQQAWAQRLLNLLPRIAVSLPP